MVMEKEQQIKKAKEFFFKNFNMAGDLLDFVSEIDGELNYNENLEHLLSITGKSIAIKTDLKGLEQKAVKEGIEIAENHATEIFNKSLSEATKNDSPSINNHFKTPIELIKMVAHGNINSLILLGAAGLGKSYTLLTTLEKEGLKEGTDYIFHSGWATPLELYQLIYNNHDKIICLDDVEGIINNEKSISILKPALWNTFGDGSRKITYLSSSEKLTVPKQFCFTGQIIMCLNQIPNNPLVQSLLSRGFLFEVNFSFEEKKLVMAEITKQPYKDTNLAQRKQVLSFLLEKATPATKDFNFRLLTKAFEVFRHNPDTYKELLNEIIEEDEAEAEIIKALKDCIYSGKDFKEQAKMFKEQTGYGQASYYRYKKKFNIKLSNYQIIGKTPNDNKKGSVKVNG